MKYLFLISAIVFLSACQDQPKKDTNMWIPLWNGHDLDGWHSYLGHPYNIDTDSLGNNIEPFGTDNDPLDVIQVVEQENENAIRISGIAWGMLYTEDSYEDYHLKLRVKWGEDMHPPREKGPRDSGLLYHGFGEPGSVYYWSDSQELQIQQGDMGDYWPVGDVAIDIPSVPLDEKFYIYSKDGDLRRYYFAEIMDTNAQDSLAKRRVFKGFDAEKPHGQWNDVELVVLGDSSIHIVNEKVVMRLYNSRKMSNDEPLTAGKIMLQSEGAEVFYKDIYLRKINSIPEKFRQK